MALLAGPLALKSGCPLPSGTSATSRTTPRGRWRSTCARARTTATRPELAEQDLEDCVGLGRRDKRVGEVGDDHRPALDDIRQPELLGRQRKIVLAFGDDRLKKTDALQERRGRPGSVAELL